MKIHGIGTDLVQISRVDKYISKYSNRWIEKIFHPEEISNAPKINAAEYYASRWACKEAFMKGMGKGGLGTKNIWVIKDGKKPKIMFHKTEEMNELLNGKEINCHVSIAHDGDYAIAYVVVEEL